MRSPQTGLLIHLKRIQRGRSKISELINTTKAQMTQEDIAWVEKILEEEEREKGEK
ncbi:MAG: hypothetical protein FWG63_01545 [Defluviitaleaceae bacterium]|nr:hypothetical protein [Defluviitaleaceae bacterium]